MKISIRTLDEQEGSVVLTRAVLDSALHRSAPSVAPGELGACCRNPPFCVSCGRMTLSDHNNRYCPWSVTKQAEGARNKAVGSLIRGCAHRRDQVQVRPITCHTSCVKLGSLHMVDVVSFLRLGVPIRDHPVARLPNFASPEYRCQTKFSNEFAGSSIGVLLSSRFRNVRL